jgi:flagellar assembly factor FliW
MHYEVRNEILGFPDTKKVSISEIDALFHTLQDTQNANISFTLVNPYMLREYSFDIPQEIQTLLAITPESKLSVYNILVIQKPLENSTINFLAPLIVNHDNNTLTQIVLDPKEHPDFGMAEAIKSFQK